MRREATGGSVRRLFTGKRFLAAVIQKQFPGRWNGLSRRLGHDAGMDDGIKDVSLGAVGKRTVGKCQRIGRADGGRVPTRDKTIASLRGAERCRAEESSGQQREISRRRSRCWARSRGTPTVGPGALRGRLRGADRGTRAVGRRFGVAGLGRSGQGPAGFRPWGKSSWGAGTRGGSSVSGVEAASATIAPARLIVCRADAVSNYV